MFELRKSEILNRIDFFNYAANMSLENNNLRIPIEKFRRVTYQNSIEYFIHLCIKYLQQQLSEEERENFLKDYYIEKREIVAYNNLYNTEAEQYVVKFKNNENKEEIFLRLNFPKLIDDQFFLISGTFYVPSLYIDDYPISIKKKSILLNSLFNPITFYISDNRVIFTGANIPLYHFFNLFLDMSKGSEDVDLIDKLLQIYNCKKATKYSKNQTISYFTKRLPHLKTEEDIKSYLENLFFDEYTRRLYNTIYNVQNMEQLIRKMLKLTVLVKGEDKEQTISFIDLRYKRVIFSELILQPLFDKVSSLAPQFGKGFVTPSLVGLDTFSIVKHFNTGLQGNHIYDTVNLVSSILLYKCRMVKPNIKEAPSEIAQLHETHFGKICPITVSSKDPGKTVFIVPGTLLDELGRFID